MKRSAKYPGGEVKLVTLQDTPTRDNTLFDRPEPLAEYFREQIPPADWYDPMKECLVVFLLNARYRLIGWNLVALGTLDTIHTHAREIYRPAIVAAAHSIVLAHNHPSGDPHPSDGDIRVTRDMKRAGELLKINLLDHLIIGQGTPQQPRWFVSMKELGLFH